MTTETRTITEAEGEADDDCRLSDDEVREYRSRTVRVNAELLIQLLINTIPDPADLLVPHPAEKNGFWAEATDAGVSITEEDEDHVLGFVDWETLGELVATISSTRAMVVLNAAHKVKKDLRR
jgi:hypothetical protein